MNSTSQPIADTLLEARRDALLDYYLGQVVAYAPEMTNLRDKINDFDDACDYLLLDLQVSAKVRATRISLATNSLQQFINRVSLNVEPGLYMTAEESENWEEFANRYNYWSADRLLRTYPESYMEPTLRLNKTEFFFQLESALNQGKITEDAVQQAVLGYLNHFEDVSNLKVIAGYEDGVNITRDKFFFVGRTRTQPYQYYWRSLNLSIRHPDTDALSPNAWSEWKPIDLPLGNIDPNLIRPIFLNNRLYIAWTEIEEQKETDKSAILAKDGEWVPPTPFLTRIKIAYAKYDGTWSTPTILREDKLQFQMTQMVAVMDIQQDPHNPFLALVSFKRVQGKNEDGSQYDYDVTFGFVCDTLLVEITDLPDDIYDNGEKGKYVGNLVWYYSREHKTEWGYPIDYRTMVLYPATRESRFPIAGNATENGSEKYGKGSIKIIVDFVYGTDDTLVVVAKSDFKFGSDEEHQYFEGGFRLINVDNGNVLDCRSLVLNEPVPELNYPSIKLGKNNRITLKAELFFTNEFSSPTASYQQEFKIGMHIRELIQLNEDNQVQYLSFPRDKTGVPLFENIRLNTLFAKKLIAIASQGIPQVLSWNTQLINEQAMPNMVPTPIDLNGANGIYFWELFFHMPFLVAWRLNIEQRLKEATQWLHYIFNPLEDEIMQSRTPGKPRYWNSRPIIDRPPSIMRMLTEPTDPDAIAASEPIHYRKAIFHFYVKNLLDQGDREYRKLTPSARIVARQIYDSVNMLLGTSPDILLTANWQPRTLQQIAEYKPNLSRRMELTMAANIPLLTVKYDASISTEPSDLFVKPVNTEYLQLWQILAQRLYNLRHNLTLDGKEFPAGWFDEPISPRDLLKQRYQRVVANRMAGMKRQAPPNYRFNPIMSRAKEAVDTLIQYGATLLSLLEKKDAADFERFRMQQQLGLYNFTLNLQQQTIEMQQASLEALNISRRAAQERQQHYKTLYDENISTAEQDVIALRSSAADGVMAAQSMATAAAVADMVPNIFGLAVGGMVFGGVLRAIGEGIRIDVESKNAKAYSLSVSEEYRRRRQEWELQYKQAEINIEEINAQVENQQRQIRISNTQLSQLEAQHEQDKVLLEYYVSRFSNESLYLWMISQMSGLYLQAYDAVNSLCLLAEASWQYETGQYEMNFIQSGLWNDLYQGLLVGEQLKLSLQRMDQAYLQHRTRRLEVVKTVSVKSLMTQAKWDTSVSTGEFTFMLDSEMFLNDYPNHIDRRIKTVAVSLPALIGPYEDVRATLTQLSNGVNIRADLNAIDYLLNPEENTRPPSVIYNLQANQSIVVSTAMEDSGLFRLNFDDELFLPFEGTGVFSQWRLKFGSGQDQLLESLSDIILHVRYTARATDDGEGNYSQQVRQRLAKRAMKQGGSHYSQ